ncbi:MAG: DUF2087 domain-containing protein [Chloroflexi bacterium]|nr:DUF2087 domain-containing protein [Chloroflexota bacterium]
MDEMPNTLDFVKAMSDADRLRIIGVLAQHPAAIKQIASELEMTFRDVFNHLSYLEFAGAVRKTDDLYILDAKALESLSKNQFGDERETYVPAPDLDEKSRKVLAAHLNSDGTIKQIPLQSAKLRVILNYLVAAFTPGVDYTEKEVNTIIKRFHEDTAGLRRDLVDAGLLARKSDGSKYWRPS